MPGPKIHQCSILGEFGQYLALYSPDDSRWTRWVLHHAERGTPRVDDDPVILKVVMHCPGCGIDLRKDCTWQIPGRPGFNEVLRGITGAPEPDWANWGKAVG